MSNPLLDLQPNKVSRDIGSYVTYVYGAPKCGKSRFAAEFPNAIFFASEPTQNTIPGIFKKDTDGLYLLITKVDKAKAVGKELQEKLRNYISENYQGFYNGLKKICKDNEINGGNVEIQPFTLGTVCFQNYCKFKEDTAATVVRTLIKRSYGYKTGKIKNLFDRLKK